jgi:hypothetical protein
MNVLRIYVSSSHMLDDLSDSARDLWARAGSLVNAKLRGVCQRFGNLSYNGKNTGA